MGSACTNGAHHQRFSVAIPEEPGNSFARGNPGVNDDSVYEFGIETCDELSSGHDGVNGSSTRSAQGIDALNK